MTTTKKSMTSNIQLFLSIVLVFVGVHMSVMFGMLNVQNLQLFVATHTYLAIFLALTVFVLPQVKKVEKEKVGMAFMAISIFKMLFGVIIVYYFLKHSNDSNVYILANFFGPFFMYLIAEVLLALRDLNS